MADVVPELPEAGVAVEAQYAADVPGLVVMVHMLRIGRPTDRAHPTLLREQLVDLLLPDPIPVSKVILPRSTVATKLGFATALVVARLAVARVAGAVSAAAREL